MDRDSTPKSHSIRPHDDQLPTAVDIAVHMWAEATTDASSSRRHDLLRDKCKALIGDGENGTAAGFFVCVGKSVERVTPADVKAWQDYLEDMGLSHASVYAYVSRLSSFYTWLLEESVFRERIRSNPVDLARPKAPTPYQTEKTQSLSDDDAAALLKTVRAEAKDDSINAVRDYAILRFFFATGKRRSEIMGLRWKDLRFTEESVIIRSREKGGLYRATEIRDPGVWKALFDYLKRSGRWDKTDDQPLLEPDEPLWLRHDRAATGKQSLTSHGFAKALKKYARRAGIGDIHLHQTRHTVARMVGEQSGDLTEVQTVLGHQNISTTRIYLERVAVKRDRHSRDVARRLGLNDSE